MINMIEIWFLMNSDLAIIIVSWQCFWESRNFYFLTIAVYSKDLKRLWSLHLRLHGIPSELLVLTSAAYWTLCIGVSIMVPTAEENFTGNIFARIFPDFVKFQNISRTWKINLLFSRFSWTHGNPAVWYIYHDLNCVWVYSEFMYIKTQYIEYNIVKLGT